MKLSVSDLMQSVRARGLLLALLALLLGSLAQGMAQTFPVPPVKPPSLLESPASSEPPPSLDRVNAYFNALKGLRADFLQVSPDGRSYTGTLYLLRPGRLRFEYNPPAQLEIIADGTTVAVRDRKLKVQDEHFISQTPLKFLLQPKVDIAKDSTVKTLKREGATIELSLEDKSTLGGTSRIRVVFDGVNYALKEWMITDPQGFETRVSLSNVDANANPDKSLFVIEKKIVTPN